MARKRFSTDLYEKYDKMAKDLVRKEVPEEFEVRDNPQKMGVDLFAYKDGKISFNIEPECKVCWPAGEDFPWATINLPVRKSKYCHYPEPTLFVIFRADGEAYKCFWSWHVLASEIKEVSNKYNKSGELFFDVEMKYTFNSIKAALRRNYKSHTS